METGIYSRAKIFIRSSKDIQKDKNHEDLKKKHPLICAQTWILFPEMTLGDIPEMQRIRVKGSTTIATSYTKPKPVRLFGTRRIW